MNLFIITDDSLSITLLGSIPLKESDAHQIDDIPAKRAIMQSVFPPRKGHSVKKTSNISEHTNIDAFNVNVENGRIAAINMNATVRI